MEKKLNHEIDLLLEVTHQQHGQETRCLKLHRWDKQQGRGKEVNKITLEHRNSRITVTQCKYLKEVIII